MKLYTLDNQFIKETDAHPHNFTGIIEYPGDTKSWFLNGVKHRIGGPAIEYHNGEKEWYINGVLHRTDGPAYEYSDVTKEWWIDGKCHRLNGPAIEYSDGTKSWYINDKRVTELECKLLYDIMKLKGLL